MIVKYPVNVWAKYGGIFCISSFHFPVGWSHLNNGGRDMVTHVSSRDNMNTLTLFLSIETHGASFSVWWADHAVFSSAIPLYTASCKIFSHSFASDDYPFPIHMVR